MIFDSGLAYAYSFVLGLLFHESNVATSTNTTPYTCTYASAYTCTKLMIVARFSTGTVTGDDDRHTRHIF